jgi:hypothetical protein
MHRRIEEEKEEGNNNIIGKRQMSQSARAR